MSTKPATVYAILCGDGVLRLHGLIRAVFVTRGEADNRIRACDDFGCGPHRVVSMIEAAVIPCLDCGAIVSGVCLNCGCLPAEAVKRIAAACQKQIAASPEAGVSAFFADAQCLLCGNPWGQHNVDCPLFNLPATMQP